MQRNTGNTEHTAPTNGSFHLGHMLNKLAGGYNHGVRTGYCYGFEDSAARISPVRLERGRVQLPSLEGGCHSAFLKVFVKSSLPGLLRLPWIRIESEGRSEIQYFERGCRGIRYINISPFVDAGASHVQLTRNHLSLGRDAELILFRNELPTSPTVLVIAPHPDDAEVAAYGLCSEVKNTYVLTITAGDTGTYNYDRIYEERGAHYRKKGELRTWNSITVPMLCGIPPERAINLGFFEDRLQEMFHDREKEFPGRYTGITDINTFRKQNLSSLADELDGTSTWNSLVANLVRLLNRIKPDIIVTPHPMLDVQQDHFYTSMALFEAVRAAELRSGRFYMYTNHIAYNHLYPYGPMGSLVSLPPSFENNPYFSSIYSHSLSAEKQKDKLFSLEAMNDLRLHTHRRFSKKATWTALKAPLKDLLGYDDTYYRRAVRSNELFFVVDFEDVYDEGKLALLTQMEGDGKGCGEHRDEF